MNNQIETKRRPFSLSISKLTINRKIIVEIIQWAFFLLFLYSAGDKIFDFEKFQLELSKSPIITDFSEYIAYSLPITEAIIAVLVVIPRTSFVGLLASFTLIVLFTTYIFLIMNYTDDIPCSCNGILEGASWSQHLVFNVVFVLLAIVGLFLQANIDSYKINQKS
ncbi:hypothetical protein SAMN05660841_03280 [Sphingobacterium nematocida]|uniref:Methylamine utilisation protein MauE domain-containing protein n=1 Tax=Sphingobacterium nematocida TaxID=1513896 RepID=A0A1T5FIE4_9SPHI|nr:MauE/DoxX family redox-associated membrane protein [Sphingobacterium nematocida]SKB95846.1 hypothetical protein SAMN05660841_03280 [Sphingobacterium nematocida]